MAELCVRQRLSAIAAHVAGSAGDTGEEAAAVLLGDGSAPEPESFEV
jgi:hypothetical protein